MTPPNSLELRGTLRAYPFAELIIEIAQARLSGSLRLSAGEKKANVYFQNGSIAFAVSNAKAFRLFSILLAQEKIDRGVLARYPNFANDVELAARLCADGVLTKEAVDAAVVSQIEELMIDALTWTEGEWVFSPLARLREELNYDINDFRILADYARCVPANVVSQRFKSVKEAFALVPGRERELYLQAHEEFVRSQFGSLPLTIEEVREKCAMPETGLLQALYVLWLGGVLVRAGWNAAFSAAKIAEIRGARVSLVREAVRPDLPQPEPVPEPEKPAEISLDEYLARVESAASLYEVLAVGQNADVPEIKSRYFEMAKLFHPDRYHRESPDLLRRIQVAFTDIAHAYETLKESDSRRTYDFKLQKETEKKAKEQAAGGRAVSGPAVESFEHGVAKLDGGDHEAAAGFFSRAVHYDPQNAVYRFYLGKALAADERRRHKAEAEMQAAARMDPKNADIRIGLARFFIDMKMFKRAQGELQRFLETTPGHKEAADLLRTIKDRA